MARVLYLGEARRSVGVDRGPHAPVDAGRNVLRLAEVRSSPLALVRLQESIRPVRAVLRGRLEAFPEGSAGLYLLTSYSSCRALSFPSSPWELSPNERHPRVTDHPHAVVLRSVDDLEKQNAAEQLRQHDSWQSHRHLGGPFAGQPTRL